MKTIFAIWATSLRSNSWTRMASSGMRMALFLYLLLSIAGGSWTAYQLTNQLHSWQQSGPSTLFQGLWLYSLTIWSGLGTMALISLRKALATDEALLLYTLPLPPATRFRALFGSFFLEQLLPLSLLQATIMLYVLIHSLGWAALSWFLLIQLGIFVVLCSLLIISLLVIAYLLNAEQKGARLIFFVCFSGISLALALLAIIIRITSSWTHPEIVLLLFASLLALFLGPLAAPLGRLYLKAFRTIQGWDHGQTSFSLPGLPSLTHLLTRNHTLTSAFLIRAIQNQSRNILFWLRLFATWLVVFVGFPLARPFLLSLHLPLSLLVIATTCAVTLLHLLEPAVCVISGEGSRFSLYLNMPFPLTQILRARLLSCLLPLLLEALLITLYLCLQLQLALSALGPVLLAVMLIVTGSTTVLVLGSAWDLDLHAMAEDAMQALMLEEVPLTPRKMLLSLLGLLSAAALFLPLYFLPLAPALLLQVLIATLLILLTWRWSLASLRRETQ